MAPDRVRLCPKRGFALCPAGQLYPTNSRADYFALAAPGLLHGLHNNSVTPLKILAREEIAHRDRLGQQIGVTSLARRSDKPWFGRSLTLPSLRR